MIIRPHNPNALISDLLYVLGLEDYPCDWHFIQHVIRSQQGSDLHQSGEAVLVLIESAVKTCQRMGLSIDPFKIVNIEPTDEGQSLVMRVEV